MNKKFVVRMIVGALMMGTSAVSMAAANSLGGSNATISGSVVSPTCTVTSWPTDIAFTPVSVADYAALSHGERIQSISQGQFELTNCPASRAMKFTVTAPAHARGNVFQALVQDSSGVNIDGLGISFTQDPSGTNFWYLDGTEHGLGTTDAQGNLNIPAHAVLIKRGNEQTPSVKGAAFSGDFKTVMQYTVSYD